VHGFDADLLFSGKGVTAADLAVAALALARPDEIMAFGSRFHGFFPFEMTGSLPVGQAGCLGRAVASCGMEAP
jgi:hypothetical protein